MRKILIILFLAFAFNSFAQKTSGVIDYNASFDYRLLLSRSTRITNDEKNRIMQTFKEDLYKIKYSLTFNEKGSYYGYPEDRSNSSWEKTASWIRRDFENNKVLELLDFNSKMYIVEDSIYTYPWKIKTDVKEIAGYICMSASTVDPSTGHSILAWFTTDIPLPIGPNIYMGLPGAILELSVDNDIVLFSAIKVTLKPDVVLPEIPKKLKGTRLTKEKFEDLVKKDAIEKSKSKRYYETSHRSF